MSTIKITLIDEKTKNNKAVGVQDDVKISDVIESIKITFGLPDTDENGLPLRYLLVCPETKVALLEEQTLKKEKVEQGDTLFLCSEIINEKQCPYCNRKLRGNAVFCSFCGKNLINGSKRETRLFEKITQFNYQKKVKSILDDKKKRFVSIGVIIALLGGLLFYNRMFLLFATRYYIGDYDGARAVQLRMVETEREEEQILEFIENRAEEFYKEYKKEKITYTEAWEKMKFLNRFGSTEEASSKMRKLRIEREGR